jgi:hypothetical protein
VPLPAATFVALAYAPAVALIAIPSAEAAAAAAILFLVLSFIVSSALRFSPAYLKLSRGPSREPRLIEIYRFGSCHISH